MKNLHLFPLLHLSFLTLNLYNFTRTDIIFRIHLKAECIAHGGWNDRKDVSTCAKELNTPAY